MKNVKTMTCKELEIAYAQASVNGDGERADEVLTEMDFRRITKTIVM